MGLLTLNSTLYSYKSSGLALIEREDSVLIIPDFVLFYFVLMSFFFREEEPSTKVESNEDKEDLDRRTIFVGNVDIKAKRSALRLIFKEYGEVSTDVHLFSLSNLYLRAHL